jgi:lipid-binding SYLF domain-containing protein
VRSVESSTRTRSFAGVSKNTVLLAFTSLFAGIDLSGSFVTQDKDETRILYGKFVQFGDILAGQSATHSYEPPVSEHRLEIHWREEVREQTPYRHPAVIDQVLLPLG